MEGSKFSLLKIGIAVVSLLVISNLVFLDFSYMQKKTEKQEKTEPVQAKVQTEIKTEKSTTEASPSSVFSYSSMPCPNACISKINESVSAIKIPAIPKETPAPTVQQTQTGSVKEYYVPLGSGSSSAEDWTDVAGVQASIDTSQYTGIKKVVFEASVQIPNGNQTVWVRLYNSTDKHPVWSSDVSLSGGTTTLLTSSAINLDSGNKIYQVQMKTQLKFTANLTQARVHITTN